MALNIGRLDRIIRVLLGLALIIMPLAGGGILPSSTWLAVLSVLAGMILLATAAFRFCPLYRIIGIRTCRM